MRASELLAKGQLIIQYKIIIKRFKNGPLFNEIFN